MSGNLRVSQQAIARGVALIAPDISQRLAMEVSIRRTILGDSSIILSPELHELPPMVVIEPFEEKPKPLSLKEIARQKALTARQTALRMKSRKQSRPCRNGRCHRSSGGQRGR